MTLPCNFHYIGGMITQNLKDPISSSKGIMNILIQELECKHDFVTRDANSLSWARIWNAINDVIITEIVFVIICSAGYDSAAKS